VAVNGQQATEFALEHRPDLIVLDLSMPAKDGIETAKERKKLMPTVPIVLFTQYADLARHFLTSTKLIDHVGSKNEPMKLVAVVKSLAPL
jgi:CheY-like chemotaxis protein